MIYFDNAATSWPKPGIVTRAMSDFMDNVGANPGRSGHRLSVEAGRIVLDAREKVAKLFGLDDPMRVVFGLNATDALNLGLRGILDKGDHVITGGMEHNSVMRPLRELQREGVELSIVPANREGFIDPIDVSRAMKPNTRLVVMNQASNVVGSLIPTDQIGRIAHNGGALFLVDAAQTAGCYPIDIERDGIDLLAFTGHKSLLGPQGTGGLVISERVDISELRPVRTGGTGSRSEHEVQPDFLPDKYESGTMNTVGLAGLAAGVSFILNETVERIRDKDVELTRRLINGLSGVDGIVVYGSLEAVKQTSTVSVNVENGSPSSVGLALDEEHDIMCRVGLHCAPSAHRSIGTFPDGTVRLAMGYFNTEEEVDAVIRALKGMV